MAWHPLRTLTRSVSPRTRLASATTKYECPWPQNAQRHSSAATGTHSALPLWQRWQDMALRPPGDWYGKAPLQRPSNGTNGRNGTANLGEGPCRALPGLETPISGQREKAKFQQETQSDSGEKLARGPRKAQARGFSESLGCNGLNSPIFRNSGAIDGDMQKAGGREEPHYLPHAFFTTPKTRTSRNISHANSPCASAGDGHERMRSFHPLLWRTPLPTLPPLPVCTSMDMNKRRHTDTCK